ncbi:hypothetical protein MNBD_GAMMA11-1068, partial [hydrothermal vent metagenome]
MFNKSGYYFIVLFALALIGFWETYFSKMLSETNFYIHFHATTMIIWFGMLITQAFLIRYKKYNLHRFIGRLSYGVFPAIVISLVLLAHHQITIYDFGIKYFRLYVLFLQLSLLFVFIIAYSLAIVYRKSPMQHARYMICTSLTMIDPAVARIPLNISELPFSYQVLTFGLTDLILMGLIFMERKQKMGREVFPIMLTVFIFFQTLNLTWTRSRLWDDFALWFAKLPLT